MLYNVLKRLIDTGRTDGLGMKLDIFYAAGKLTEEEYIELTRLLPVITADEEIIA